MNTQLKEFGSHREAMGWLNGQGLRRRDDEPTWRSKRLKAEAHGPVMKGRKYVVKALWGVSESALDGLLEGLRGDDLDDRRLRDLMDYIDTYTKFLDLDPARYHMDIRPQRDKYNAEVRKAESVVNDRTGNLKVKQLQQLSRAFGVSKPPRSKYAVVKTIAKAIHPWRQAGKKHHERTTD